MACCPPASLGQAHLVPLEPHLLGGQEVVEDQAQQLGIGQGRDAAFEFFLIQTGAQRKLLVVAAQQLEHLPGKLGQGLPADETGIQRQHFASGQKFFKPGLDGLLGQVDQPGQVGGGDAMAAGAVDEHPEARDRLPRLEHRQVG
jgi:hypothetical protein